MQVASARAAPLAPHSLQPTHRRGQVADRIKKHMTQRVPRILPPDVESTVKDWASNVESLVDKVVSGEAAQPWGYT